ncbi:MAG: FIST N-terminal domain-containing protein [Acidimicrobiales bacterium]
MPFASALSEHPDAAAATGEVAGALLEALGPSPDLVLVHATGAHRDAFADVVDALGRVLTPHRLLGATAVAVVGGAREVEEQPALSLWGARLSTAGPADLRPLRLDAIRTGDGLALLGFDPEALRSAGAVVLLCDPGFPTDEVLAALRREAPALPVVGGVASAGFGPGANRLALDGRVFDDGAVGVVVPPGLVDVELVVSQGCRPIGEPRTVTRAEANVVLEIAGTRALDHVAAVLETASPRDRGLAERGLHLGRVVDEHRIELGRGDFLVRNLVGADPDRGSIVVNDLVEVGATVQLQVRDAEAADEDLRELLAGREADAALVFTCNGRGRACSVHPTTTPPWSPS